MAEDRNDKDSGGGFEGVKQTVKNSSKGLKYVAAVAVFVLLVALASQI